MLIIISLNIRVQKEYTRLSGRKEQDFPRCPCCGGGKNSYWFCHDKKLVLLGYLNPSVYIKERIGLQKVNLLSSISAIVYQKGYNGIEWFCNEIGFIKCSPCGYTIEYDDEDFESFQVIIKADLDKQFFR